MDLNTSLFFEANSSHDIEYAQRYLESLSPAELEGVLKRSGIGRGDFKDVASLIASLFPEVGGGDLTPLTCAGCGKGGVKACQRQTRSTDEGVTTFFVCGGCGNTWSV